MKNQVIPNTFIHGSIDIYFARLKIMYFLQPFDAWVKGFGITWFSILC